jgi:hypothetical protein
MLKNLFKYLVNIFFVLVIANCVPIHTKYPEWYINRPKNTQNSLYGVGEGYDLDSAKQNALKNISEQILITVSSKSKMYKAETNIAYIEESQFKLSEKTEEITFSDYKVLNSETNASRFFILIEVNRQNLIKTQKTELKKIENKINALDKKTKTSLERLVNLMSIKELIQTAETKVRIIKVLQPEFEDDKIYFAKYNNYEKEYINLRNNIVFHIKTNDSFDVKLANVFKKHLNENNIKTIDQFNTNLTLLDIYSNVSVRQIYGSYNAKARIHITLLVRGSTLRTNNIELKGSSVVSREEALKNVARHLDNEINKQGLFKILKLEK